MRFTFPILARAAAVTAASTLASYASHAHTALTQAMPSMPSGNPEPTVHQLRLSFRSVKDAARSKMYLDVNTISMAAREDCTSLMALLANPANARYLTDPVHVQGYAWTIFVEACASLNVDTVDYLLKNFPLLAENISKDNFVALREAWSACRMTSAQDLYAAGYMSKEEYEEHAENDSRRKLEKVVLRLAQIPEALEYMRNSDDFKDMVADVRTDNKCRPWFCAST